MKKKFYQCLFFLFLSNILYSQSIYYSWSNGGLPGPSSGCTNGSLCLYGPNFVTWGKPIDGSGENSTIQIRGTHGCLATGWYEYDYGLIFNARNMSNGTWIRGDGMLIAYQFKKGYTYTITVNAIFSDDLYDQRNRPYENNPSLQLRATNNPVNGSLCTVTAEPIDIYSANEPYFEMFANAPIARQWSKAVFTFTSPNCFSYLWIASKPNQSESAGTIRLQNIRVEDAAIYTITGASSICTGAENYSLLLNNNPFIDPVNWTLSNPSNSIATLSPNGNNGVKVTKIGNGNITLKASIDVCGNSTQVATKPITVGLVPLLATIVLANSTQPMYTNNNVCVHSGSEIIRILFPGDVQNLRAAAYSGNYPTVYKDGTQWIISYSLGSAGGSNGSGTGTLRIEYDNSCGHIVQFVGFHNTCTYGYSYFNITPNPASSEVYITSISNNTKLQNGKEVSNTVNDMHFIQEVKVIDKYGNIFKNIRYKTKNNRQSIDISNLSTDIYIIQIFDGKHWYNYPLSVRR